MVWGEGEISRWRETGASTLHRCPLPRHRGILTIAMPVSDEAFKKVADLVGDKKTPIARRSTKSEQLQLYGLYKRATVDSSQRSATR